MTGVRPPVSSFGPGGWLRTRPRQILEVCAGTACEFGYRRRRLARSVDVGDRGGGLGVVAAGYGIAPVLRPSEFQSVPERPPVHWGLRFSGRVCHGGAWWPDRGGPCRFKPLRDADFLSHAPPVPNQQGDHGPNRSTVTPPLSGLKSRALRPYHGKSSAIVNTREEWRTTETSEELVGCQPRTFKVAIVV